MLQLLSGHKPHESLIEAQNKANLAGDYTTMKFGTKAVHAGVEPDPSTGAIMTPIYQTSTFVQVAPGDHNGYEYGRTHNPTRTALQTSMAALEGGKHGICFASGMAATDTICKLLRPGDEVISTNDLYGGTFRLFTGVYEKYGIKFHFLPIKDGADLASHVNEKTKLIWLETPTNPTLSLVDIASVCAAVKDKEIKVVVDNTFATPYLQQPLSLGADVVVHSATKYIGGHSDSVMGAIVTSDDVLAERFYYFQNAAGAIPGPQDCFLILRGIKTLHIRMEQHCKNAAVIADMLAAHPKVNKVNYPGHSSHTGHEIAKKQMRLPGGMLSFSLASDSVDAAFELMKSLKVFALAESLGGVESLIGHPATMTHASIPLEERKKTGVLDSLIRLSVGIEDVDDLVADLKQALDKIA